MCSLRAAAATEASSPSIHRSSSSAAGAGLRLGPGGPKALRLHAGEGDTLDVYSPQTALGSAINGKSKGDTVSYLAPNGKELQVVIVDAVPYTG